MGNHARDDAPAVVPTSSEYRQELEYCAWYGGDDPNEANTIVYADLADAEEISRWIKDGRVAYRVITLSPWAEIDPEAQHV